MEREEENRVIIVAETLREAFGFPFFFSSIAIGQNLGQSYIVAPGCGRIQDFSFCNCLLSLNFHHMFLECLYMS